MQLEFWGEEKEQGSAAQPQRGSSRVIRASEIGEYVYCHRAWWLGRVKGVPNANRAQLDAGIVRHRAHGQNVQRADALQRAGWVLMLIALVLGIVLMLMLFGVH